jgi:integrase
VDLNRKLAWVHPDEAKARKAIPVPLNGEALSILQKQIGMHRDHVFIFTGSRSSSSAQPPGTRHCSAPASRTSAGTTCVRTWASWHVHSGTPLHVLQELGGWASYAKVHRYAHLAADHLAPWAERLARSRADRGTNPSQPTAGGNDDVMPASRKSL